MKKVIIIGAGIAGLTAGVYARQSGFDVTIYEAHSIPGGASTSWSRKGYLFEGGMHWLTGSSPKNPLYALWCEIGALDECTSVHNRDPFFSMELEGKTVSLYRDGDKLQKHFLEIAPEDEKEIKMLCKDIKKCSKLQMPISDIKGVKMGRKIKFPHTSFLSMLPAMFRIPFYARLTAEEYARRYQSRLLRELFVNIVGKDNSAMALLFTMATLASGDGGYPKGGSLGMAHRIAQKCIALGVRICYQTPVEKVLVVQGIATGVVVNGETIYGDAVIVTQDTRVAIDRLFDRPLEEPWAEKMRRDTIPMLNTFICLGVRADLSDIPESVGISLEKPIYCAGEKLESIGINRYIGESGYEKHPLYAPDGCTALTSTIMGDSYDWWKEKQQTGQYEEEKKKLVEAFTDALSLKYPRIVGKIEVWDVATPLTYERYIHSYKGSWMSVMKKGDKMSKYPTKSESISKLYFAGQRLMIPGGLPVALETGRKSVQYVCRDFDMVFQGDMAN